MATVVQLTSEETASVQYRLEGLLAERGISLHRVFDAEDFNAALRMYSGRPRRRVDGQTGRRRSLWARSILVQSDLPGYSQRPDAPENIPWLPDIAVTYETDAQERMLFRYITCLGGATEESFRPKGIAPVNELLSQINTFQLVLQTEPIRKIGDGQLWDEFWPFFFYADQGGRILATGSSEAKDELQTTLASDVQRAIHSTHRRQGDPFEPVAKAMLQFYRQGTVR